jgi:hypothetical protein
VNSCRAVDLPSLGRRLKRGSRRADGEAVAGGPTIAHILLDGLRERLRAERGCTAIELAIRAAVEPGREARAWALVALAARLRADGSRELARVAIDAAVALDAGAGPTRAAYTCAVALHADDGDLRSAVKLGEELMEEGHNEFLLQAMSRVYWDLWKDTEDAVWLRGWRRVNGLLEGSDAQVA